jgi:hypothetical protein
VHGVLTAIKEKLTEEQWGDLVTAMEARDVNIDEVLAATTAPELDEVT